MSKSRMANKLKLVQEPKPIPVVGKIYTVEHKNKGKFCAKVVLINGNWATVFTQPHNMECYLDIRSHTFTEVV